MCLNYLKYQPKDLNCTTPQIPDSLTHETYNFCPLCTFMPCSFSSGPQSFLVLIEVRASFCSWQAYLGMINSSWLIKRLEMLRHDFSMLPHCRFMTAPFQSKNLSQPFPKNVDWLQDMRLFRTFFHIINGQICSDWFSVLAVRSPFIRISQCLCFSLCWSFLGSTKPQWGKCLSAPWLTPVTLQSCCTVCLSSFSVLWRLCSISSCGANWRQRNNLLE